MLGRTALQITLHYLPENIFQKSFDAGNFRKKVLSLNVLEKLAIKDLSSSKRGAFYYTFKKNIGKEQPERIIKI